MKTSKKEYNKFIGYIKNMEKYKNIDVKRKYYYLKSLNFYIDYISEINYYTELWKDEYKKYTHYLDMEKYININLYYETIFNFDYEYNIYGSVLGDKEYEKFKFDRLRAQKINKLKEKLNNN